MASLAQALEYLTASDREAALDALLGTWRATRSPEIADVIDLVSQDVTRVLPGIEGATRLAFQTAWLDVANEGRSTDIGRLLFTFGKLPCTQIRDRLTRLEARAHDPRVAHTLGKMIANCPCTSTPNSPMWTRIFKLTGDIGDARVNGPLAAFLENMRPGGTFHTLHRSRVEKLLVKITPPTPLASEDVQLVNELQARARAMLEAAPVPFESKAKAKRGGKEQSEEELLDLVYADPEADDPRLVYGDWLLERGHPRGEFIALQFKRHRGEALAKKEIQREKALIAEHGRRWMGAIEPVVSRDNIRFSRGFLDTCTVSFQTMKERELIGHPSWGTVRELIDAPIEVITHPIMRSLRALRVTSRVASSITSGGAPRVEELHVTVPNNTDQIEQIDPINRGDAFPRLRRLTFAFASEDIGRVGSVRPIDFDWLLRGQVIKRLEHLGLEGYRWDPGDEARPDVGPWLDALAPFRSLVSVTLAMQYQWQVRLTRPFAATPWSLDLACIDAKFTPPIQRCLQNVPPATFERVTVQQGSEVIDPTTITPLASILHRVARSLVS